VVERGPEKAGVGGSIPSLATIILNNLERFSRHGPTRHLPVIRVSAAQSAYLRNHFDG
jgi:hypothetical protein